MAMLIFASDILELHLKDETCDADLLEIADGTDGYSGSDLKSKLLLLHSDL